MSETKFDLEDRLVKFSCRIIVVVEELPAARAESAKKNLNSEKK